VPHFYIFYSSTPSILTLESLQVIPTVAYRGGVMHKIGWKKHFNSQEKDRHAKKTAEKRAKCVGL